MFGWLTGGATDVVGKAIDGVVETIDNLHTSDEEKEQLKLKFKELEQNLEKEVSARWIADSQSDSWLPKNIRPLTLIYLMFLLTTFAFTDGNIGEFKINPAYIELFQALAITAFGGYFVSRGVEKVTKFKK